MTTNKQYTKNYKVVEIQSTKVSNELGDWTKLDVVLRGTTLATAKGQIRLINVEGVLAKACLANHVVGLPEATTIVHIPTIAIDGSKLDDAEWQSAWWYAKEKFGVPMWTQSSIKGHTFYFVTYPMFDKMIAEYNPLTDGPKFAAYGALLFSEMDAMPTLNFDVKGIEVSSRGQDGNCVVPQAVWGNRSKQFRSMVLNPKTGMPMSIGKGVGMPKLSAKVPEFNTTQVKMGTGLGSTIVMTNTAVSACKENGGLIHMWISAEPILMLKDSPMVRTFLTARVKKEVSDYLSMLTEEGRPMLINRLRGMMFDENGGLETAKRALIEALRSNLPWCKELEDRCTRFAIREICESIIPSGAVKAVASLQIVDDAYGVSPCRWADAKCFGIRIPVTGALAIIPLPKNPYIDGKGMVVTSEVAKRDAGDGDGDLLAVVTEKEVVMFFAHYLDRRIKSGLKPAKTRAQEALTADFMVDAALKQVGNGWMVGALTVAGWKMLQIGDTKTASELLDLANIEPMTYKWQIEYSGMPFDKYVSKVYGKIRDDLKGISLQWRDMAGESKNWKSPREMVSTTIANPLSHIDACWNAGVEAAKEWAKTNVLKPLSISQVASIAFGERGIVIAGSEWREAREMINEWGKYWADVHENNTLNGNHSMMYHRAAEWAKTASTGAICAMLVWRPKNAESTGFALKWHSVFAAGRAHEALGYHPAFVTAMLTDKKFWKTNAKAIDALVACWLES